MCENELTEVFMLEDEIIEMIHCNSPAFVQNEGIKLALQKDDLDFVMYYSSDPAYAENCAKIFTSLEYQKCTRYFDDLFSWIEDLNTSGAIDIFEYLSCAPADLLLESFVVSLDAAVKRKNKTMLDILNMILQKNHKLNEIVREMVETGDGSVSPK